MIAYAASTYAVAMRRLDNAIAMIEDHASGGPATLVADAYRELLALRGVMHAVAQLEQIATEFGAADTERPSGLRVIK